MFFVAGKKACTRGLCFGLVLYLGQEGLLSYTAANDRLDFDDLLTIRVPHPAC